MRRDITDALAAYALGAVGHDEARSIRSALRGDPRRSRSADGYRDTALRLLARFEPVEPGEEVWNRIEAATLGRDTALPPSLRRSSGPILAAIAVAAAFFLGIGTATMFGGEALPVDATAVLAAAGQSATLLLADPGSGEAVASLVVGEDGTAVFSSDGLAPLDDGHTYQLWSVVDGAVVSAGLLGPAPSDAALRLEAEPTVLAVTIERVGGVVVSDQDPVAVWSAEA